MVPKIAALYCRISKSSEAHDESNSISNQKVILQKAAVQYGFDSTQFFIDDGYSGTDFNRPGLKRLEDAIQSGAICAVLVKDISRLGRDYLKVGYYLEQLFPRHNVRFIAVSGGIDSDTNSMDFVPLYSVMDEWYARDISRKIRLIYQSRAAGIPVGQPVYGYVKSADRSNQWVIDPEAATTVQYIYQLAFCGYGSEQIARRLEDDRILTPAYYRLRNGGNRTPTSASPYHWSSTTVAKILCSQEYCGDVVNLKTYSNSYKDKKRRENSAAKMVILRNVHQPIIERSLWEYIQHKRKQHKVRKKAGKPSLFSGFLRCGNCGSNLHYHFNQVNPSIEYYNCSNYVGNRGTCPDTHYVRLDDLKEIVLCSLNRLLQDLKDPVFRETIWQRVSSKSQARACVLEAEVQEIDSRLRKMTAMLTAAFEDKVNGIIDEETFMLLTGQFKKERVQLKERQNDILCELETARNVQKMLDYFMDLVDEQEPIAELSREIVGRFIDWIAVYPTDRSVKPHTQRIDIYYHFIGKI